MDTFTLIVIIINSVCVLFSIGVIAYGCIRNAIVKKRVKADLEKKFKQ